MTDTKDFEAFMQAYQNMVFSTAVRLLGNETEAQDVAQEVFLRAFEHYHEISGSPTAGGWLKTVTRNLCLNHLTRYRARWRFFSEMFSSDNEDEIVDLPAPDTMTGELNTTDYRRLLEQALQRLPATQRVPLVLFHFENLRYEEIAEKLGVSLSKVKTDIFRAREALRKKLKLKLGNDDEWGHSGSEALPSNRPESPRSKRTEHPRLALAPDLA
jgi:RNA polymerase sigma-70 factor (ECF subfamily)